MRRRRYRWLPSPCFLSRTIDLAVHVGMPAAMRAIAQGYGFAYGLLMLSACRLERTSPRYAPGRVLENQVARFSERR